MLQDFTSAVRELQRAFGDAFNAYRPELYYMRGPGPACHAKVAPKRPSTKPISLKTMSAHRRLAKARG
jgi:hypothetical protein